MTRGSFLPRSSTASISTPGWSDSFCKIKSGLLFSLVFLSESASWPADSVHRRPVAQLQAAARNARTHSRDQVQQIANAIRDYGEIAVMRWQEFTGRQATLQDHTTMEAARQTRLTHCA
jgi:hypothetical protein